MQLDPEDNTFCGCIQLSNNIAELSAVPHVMTDAICWRRENSDRRGIRLAPHSLLIAVNVSAVSQVVCARRAQCLGRRVLVHWVLVWMPMTRLPCALGLATGLSWVSWGEENDGPVLHLECLCQTWPGDMKPCAGEMTGPGFWKSADFRASFRVGETSCLEAVISQRTCAQG